MSISTILTPPIQDQMNVYFNNIDCRTINGYPVPSFGVDQNPANIIYRPGYVGPIDDNIVSSWSEIVSKAQQINVNECLTVYVDDSIVSPAVIDQSLDCKGRVSLTSKSYSASALTQVQINDGITLTDPAPFVGTIQIICESLTGPNIIMSEGGILIFQSGAYLTNTVSSLVPSIEVPDNGSMIMSVALGGKLSTLASGVPLINMGSNSFMVYTNVMDTTGFTYTADSIASTDNTSNLVSIGDGSFDQTLFINTGYTGAILQPTIDKAKNIYYDDNLVLPNFGTSNIQGAIDTLKNIPASAISYNDTLQPPELFTSNVQGAIDELKFVSSLSVVNEDAQFLPAGTDTPVLFSATNFTDPTGGINYSPGNTKIEINVSGQYLITWCLWFKDVKFTKRAYIAINGNISAGNMWYAQAENYTNDSVPIRLCSSALIQLQAGDFFELVAYSDNDTTISQASKSEYSRLQIIRQNRVYTP
jgi:hypothetical protein